jgi:hypothetical protein
MNGADFVRTIIREMHGAMLGDVHDLTPEHWTWKPADGANPIGFIFWHYVRTEDDIIHAMQQQPSRWQAEKWGEKLGMDPQAQGTGFGVSEVEKAAALPPAEVIAYAEAVFADSDEFLAGFDDASLDHVTDPDHPRRTRGMMLRNFVIAHGWWHLGEIKYLKGLQGMPAAR